MPTAASNPHTDNAFRVFSNTVSATITGQISTDGRTVYPSGGIVDQAASLNWTITYKANETENSTTQRYGVANPHWTIVRMLGSVTWHGSPNLSCSGTLSAVDGAGGRDLSDFLTVSPGPSNVPRDQEKFLVKAAVPSKAIVASSDTNPADAQCNSEVAADFLQNGPTQGDQSFAWSKILQPEEAFGVKGGSVPLSFNYSAPVPGSPPGETVTVTDRASETITFVGPHG